MKVDERQEESLQNNNPRSIRAKTWHSTQSNKSPLDAMKFLMARNLTVAFSVHGLTAAAGLLSRYT